MKSEYIDAMFGKNPYIQPFVIIGLFPEGSLEKVVIGNNARIRSGTVIYRGNIIGDNLNTGHNVLVRENTRIGNNVSIGTGSEVGFEVLIEDEVRLHSNVFVPEYCIIKEGAWLGPGVGLTNDKHPPSSQYIRPDSEGVLKEEAVIVEKLAKVGSNSSIGAGVTIGESALVGHGAVVTKDVEPYSVVVGNPAKFLCYLNELPGDPYANRKE